MKLINPTWFEITGRGPVATFCDIENPSLHNMDRRTVKYIEIDEKQYKVKGTELWAVDPLAKCNTTGTASFLVEEMK